MLQYLRRSTERWNACRRMASCLQVSQACLYFYRLFREIEGFAMLFAFPGVIMNALVALVVNMNYYCNRNDNRYYRQQYPPAIGYRTKKYHNQQNAYKESYVARCK